MRCGYCNREIPEDVKQEPCGACPGGCRKIHCPHCGYENPAPAGWLKKLLEKKEKDSK
ncbi:MAG TPA: hypothetical protein VJ882_03765 [Desulfuromonadales bacterium]|nr:hypothetical protein [Desulfuromonadales bacterium]